MFMECILQYLAYALAPQEILLSNSVLPELP